MARQSEFGKAFVHFPHSPVVAPFAERTVPGAQLDDPLLWGGFALFALFVFDYAHSSREEVRASYDGWKFLADLLIVSFLFLAGKAVLKAPVLPGVDYVRWLFFAKLAAVITTVMLA